MHRFLGEKALKDLQIRVPDSHSFATLIKTIENKLSKNSSVFATRLLEQKKYARCLNNFRINCRIINESMGRAFRGPDFMTTLLEP